MPITDIGLLHKPVHVILTVIDDKSDTLMPVIGKLCRWTTQSVKHIYFASTKFSLWCQGAQIIGLSNCELKSALKSTV